MTIINIGSKLDLIQAWLKTNPTINSLFSGGIWAGKPLDISSGMSLYFGVSNNSPLIETDRKGQKNIKKRGLLEFVITTNIKNIPDVEIYETLDILSNEIVGKEINLSGFIINGIQEGVQSGKLVDTNENPLIIAQYIFDYTNNY